MSANNIVRKVNNFVWKGAWVTSTAYAVNDSVQQNGSGYICLIAHTSGTFATDLAAGKWSLFVEGVGGNSIQVDSSGGTSDTYGVLGGLVNSSNRVYTVSLGSYISGSLRVYLNGQLQTQGSSEDWTETTPGSGTFTFTTAPVTGDIIIVMYQFSTGSTGNADTLDGQHASSLVVPSGTVSMYAGSSAPSGYLLCNGSAVSRSTYSALFTAISTTWGIGDGSTTFNLPDMRGVFPKGAGTTNRAAGVDGNGTAYGTTLGTYSQDKLQGHRHKFVLNGSDGEGGNFATTYTGAGGGAAGIVVGQTGAFSQFWIGDCRTGDNGTLREGNLTEPQNAGINYIIKT